MQPSLRYLYTLAIFLVVVGEFRLELDKISGRIGTESKRTFPLLPPPCNPTERRAGRRLLGRVHPSRYMPIAGDYDTLYWFVQVIV